jgi:hypothetical protein
LAHGGGGGVVERILVPFEGEGSGVGELTWGQRDIWLAMQEQSSSLGIGGAFPLPPGKTVEEIADDLRFLVSRHQSLRTRLQFGADGHPRQVLAKSGEIPLEVIEAGGGEPAEIAAALYRRYDQRVFDYASEWPVRWAVISRQGAATHWVSEICHLATDGMGSLTLLADLDSRDPGTGLAAGPVTATQPLEQARWQASPAGRRQNDTALRYWERLLRAIPARRYPGSADKRSPRHWEASYDSPASHLAIQAIAARARVATSTVLLAVAAVGFTRVTGINPAVIQVEVSNRFRPGLATAVSPVGQTGLCVIDVAGITFDEAVARAFRSAMGAYKHGYYDPVQQEELVARVSQERGEDIDITCYVNDRRLRSRQEPTGQPPAAGDIRAALPRSTLTWGSQLDHPRGRCFLHINDIPDTISCTLHADTHYVSPADMEACLRGLEEVAVEAALDPAARTGVRSPIGHA